MRMFFDLKRKYDSAIKDLELEITDLENRILENEFNLELMKNNEKIEDRDKEEIKIKYSLKYDKDAFSPNTKILKTKDAYDLSDNNPEGDEVK
jgi:hypothetical protein